MTEGDPNQSYQENHQYNTAASIGLVVKDNMVAGARVLLNFSHNKFYPSPGSDYLKGNPGLTTEKGFSVNAGLSSGVSCQVRRSLFLEAAFQNIVLGYERKNRYEQVPNGDDNKSVISNYNLQTSLGNCIPLQIGMRWILPGK